MDSLGLKSQYICLAVLTSSQMQKIINWETKWSKCTVDPRAATLAVSKLVSSIASVKLIWTRHRLDPVQQMAAFTHSQTYSQVILLPALHAGQNRQFIFEGYSLEMNHLEKNWAMQGPFLGHRMTLAEEPEVCCSQSSRTKSGLLLRQHFKVLA